MRLIIKCPNKNCRRVLAKIDLNSYNGIVVDEFYKIVGKIRVCPYCHRYVGDDFLSNYSISKCPFCNYVTINTGIIKHIRRHHFYKTLKCPLCQRECHGIKGLKTHLHHSHDGMDIYDLLKKFVIVKASYQVT